MGFDAHQSSLGSDSQQNGLQESSPYYEGFKQGSFRGGHEQDSDQGYLMESNTHKSSFGSDSQQNGLQEGSLRGGHWQDSDPGYLMASNTHQSSFGSDSQRNGFRENAPYSPYQEGFGQGGFQDGFEQGFRHACQLSGMRQGRLSHSGPETGSSQQSSYHHSGEQNSCGSYSDGMFCEQGYSQNEQYVSPVFRMSPEMFRTSPERTQYVAQYAARRLGGKSQAPSYMQHGGCMGSRNVQPVGSPGVQITYLGTSPPPPPPARPGAFSSSTLSMHQLQQSFLQGVASSRREPQPAQETCFGESFQMQQAAEFLSDGRRRLGLDADAVDMEWARGHGVDVEWARALAAVPNGQPSIVQKSQVAPVHSSSVEAAPAGPSLATSAKAIAEEVTDATLEELIFPELTKVAPKEAASSEPPLSITSKWLDESARAKETANWLDEGARAKQVGEAEENLNNALQEMRRIFQEAHDIREGIRDLDGNPIPPGASPYHGRRFCNDRPHTRLREDMERSVLRLVECLQELENIHITSAQEASPGRRDMQAAFAQMQPHYDGLHRHLAKIGRQFLFWRTLLRKHLPRLQGGFYMLLILRMAKKNG